MSGFDGYANVVLVGPGLGFEARHGFDARHARLSSVAVHAGERVETGELLGLTGRTGCCTGTNLHFELRDRGTPLEPAPPLR